VVKNHMVKNQIMKNEIPSPSQFLGPYLDGLESGIAPDFNAILRELDAQADEVETLRREAASKVKELNAEVARLANEHKQAVVSTRKEFTSALDHIKALETKVTSVSGKAIAMGQRLEKVDKQRRRAQEAEAAIEIFEAIRSPDESLRAEALESIIKDGAHLESAAMLRKLDAIARGAEESKSVLESLAILNEQFEMAVISEFDQESEAWRSTQSPDSLEGMRKCAAALVCFNGGSACIQRYISTRPAFIDEAIMLRDEVRDLPRPPRAFPPPNPFSTRDERQRITYGRSMAARPCA
jgi:outer membrane murein-binding lipoprotein Lpp